MQDKLLRKKLTLGIILLFVGTSVLPSISGNFTEVLKNYSSNRYSILSENKGNILVYATEDGFSYIYDKTFFDTSLPAILENYGYTVTVTDRITTPAITTSLLADYDELWILSTKRYTTGVFSNNEIYTILEFKNARHGLLIMADHYDYVADANQISVPLGVTFFGSVNHGAPSSVISPTFQSHPLFTNVKTIASGSDDGQMSVNNPVRIVATYQGDNLIATLDNENGRTVFDVSFTRLFNAGINGYSWILSGDTPQYVKNIADWLIVPNSPPNTPSKPSGQTNGKIGQEYSYTTSATDPEGDQVYYWWDWGDGNTSGWLGPYGSGVTAGITYTWTTKGLYSIKVKVKDIKGAESGWSDPLPISMPYSYNQLLHFLELLFQRFSNAFPLLRQILGYKESLSFSFFSFDSNKI